MVAGDNKWLNPTQEIQEVQKGKRRTAVSRGKESEEEQSSNKNEE